VYFCTIKIRIFKLETDNPFQTIHIFKLEFHFIPHQVEIRGPESTKWSVYLGNSAADVKKSFKEHQSVFSWLTSSQSQGPKEVQLTPFNSTCLGVAPAKSEGVEARLILLHVSYYRLGACIAGILFSNSK